jgi:tRNA pseudouridine38/39 synthase
MQVVALLLRSSGKADAPLPGWQQEQDFAHMLNRVLPDTIRVLGWADVPQDFHAR